MKKTIIIVLAAIILLIGGFYILDAYLCSHLYYGITPFLSCAGGQGKGIDIMGNSENLGIVLMGLVASLTPILYLLLSKNRRLPILMLLLYIASAIYMAGVSIIRDSLFGQGLLIMLFNIAVIYFLFYRLLVVMTLLGDLLFSLLRWHITNSVQDMFLKFTLGLVVFCFVNVVLLQIHAFYGLIILAEFLLGIYLYVKRKKVLGEMIHSVEHFISHIHTAFTKNNITKVLYIGVLIVAVWYICAGLNLAYIPYPTAWDANHAYIFFPRAWAINNGIYRGSGGLGGTMPSLWYGFLTFWFKFADAMPGKGLFGISPDAITIIMNFWSGPLVLLSSGFAFYAFMQLFISDKNNHNNILYGVLLGVFMMMLWLTSGMGAFLVFVDNKTDLAVMFFTIIAVYAGMKFLLSLHNNVNKNDIKQYAILSGLFFGASAIAKSTGMFDIVHFGLLFLMQWNWLLVGIGGYLFMMGGLGLTKLLLVSQFVTIQQSYMLLGVGGILFVVGLWPLLKKGFRVYYMRFFAIWVGTVLAVLLLFKLPFALIQQVIANGSISVPQTLRNIFLGYVVPSNNAMSSNRILLASNFSPTSLQATLTNNSGAIVSTTPQSLHLEKVQCLAELGKTNLYANLKTAGNDSSNEDLGRYVGYGQKTFSSLWLLSWIPNGCYSIYQDARILCNQITTIQTLPKDQLIGLLQNTKKDINKTDILDGWIRDLTSVSDSLAETKIKRNIVSYIQSNTLLVTDKSIAIPYKLLIPFNVTFNWSLQNLSSYYTDIGITWLFGLLLSLLGLLYGLLHKHKRLAQFSLITLGARAVWRIIASAILWYSLGLIIWTIIGTVSFLYEIFVTKSKKDSLQYNVVYGVVGLFVFWGIVQLLFNIFRISSQGAGGPFTWYKSNVGEKYVINEQLMATKTIKIGFNADDVLSLQFPHYNGIRTILNQRGEDEGVVIAGTYLQYFINDQTNVQADGFLSIFRENISDNDVCKSYLRLKDQKKKYLVIDPNIASVVMGEGNKSLFERFYAVVDESGKLQQHGTLTMLQALAQKGYIKLLSTNNLITKYAFIIPDEQLGNLLGISDPEKLLLERAKMTAARFFPNSDSYANAVLQLLSSRINTYDGISDIADIMGKAIRTDVVIDVAKFVEAGVTQQVYAELQKKLENLTEDEKITLQQYFSLRKLQKENPQQYRQSLISFVSQSINNGSQLIALSVE